MAVREVTYPMGHVLSHHVFSTLYLLNAQSPSQSPLSVFFTTKKDEYNKIKTTFCMYFQGDMLG